MNTKKNIDKLGRTKAHRELLKLNLINSLILYEHMKTTKAKAKAIKGMFDKIVNISKKGKQELTTKRQLISILRNKNSVAKLQEVFAKRFKNEQGGFLKVYKLGRRPGDNAEMVNIMVKGYVYKDIGKNVSSSAKKEQKQSPETVDKKIDYNKFNEVAARSQVSGNVAQGKVKSRSGI